MDTRYPPRPISVNARLFITATVLTGFSVLVLGLRDGQWNDPIRYTCYMILAVVASGMKVNLPGVTGTMSVIFLFILIGINELSLAQTLVMGCLGTVVQCFWDARTRP